MDPHPTRIARNRLSYFAAAAAGFAVERGLLNGDVAFHEGIAVAFATRNPINIPTCASVVGPLQFQSAFTVSEALW